MAFYTSTFGLHGLQLIQGRCHSPVHNDYNPLLDVVTISTPSAMVSQFRSKVQVCNLSFGMVSSNPLAEEDNSARVFQYSSSLFSAVVGKQEEELGSCIS